MSKAMSRCAECHMLVEDGEYHPYAACLMFKSCRNGDTVRENLRAVGQAALRRAVEIAKLAD